MARLLTCGFETQRLNSTLLTTAEGEDTYFIGAPTINTAIPYSGAACLQCATGGSAYLRWEPAGGLADITYSAGFMHRRTGNPTAAVQIITVWDAGAVIRVNVRVNTNGDIAVYDSDGTRIGGLYPSVADTWYLIELQWVIPVAGNGTASLWIDGVLKDNAVSGVFINSVANRVHCGVHTSTGGPTFYVDDLRINDNTGGNQNGRVGQGRVWLLKPTVLGASGRGNWTTGGGGTTNLHDAIDNTPPVGVAVASDTATSQITNPTSGDSTAYFDTQTYDAVVPVTDTITLVQGLWRTGISSTAGTGSGAGQVFGNPVVSNQSLNFEGSTAVAGTDPAGWRTQRSVYSYAPAVTRSAVAQINVRKAELTTREFCCDLMGVLVESAPGAATRPKQSRRLQPRQPAATGGSYN